MALSNTNYEAHAKSGNIHENWLFQFFNQDSYLEFDGSNDYVDCGLTTAASATSVTGQVSIGMWVNLPTLGSSQMIFSNNSNESAYGGIWLSFNADNKLVLQWGDTTGAGTNDRQGWVSDSAVITSANVWYFVAITTDFHASNDANTVVLVGPEGGSLSSITSFTETGGSNDDSPDYLSSNAYLYFGRRGDTTDTDFGAFKIRNFGMWSTQLNSNDAEALYNSGSYKSFLENFGNYDDADNLLAYWEFNNGDSTVRDLKGTLSGSVNGAKYGGFLPISTGNTTVDDIFYHGVITTNNISIRESLDLMNSKASSNNIRIDVANFVYQGDDFSAEILLGNNNYLNRGVRVFSQLNLDPDIADCMQIFHGRLTDVKHTIDNVNLSISSHRPWDNISIPLTKSSNNVFVPIAYGDYDGNNATTETKKNKVFPIPVVKATGGKIYFAMHKAISDSSLLLNYYDSTSELFPVLNADSNTTSKYDINTVGVDVNITRSFRIYGDSAVNEDGGSDWSNPSNILAPAGDATTGFPTGSERVNTATDYIAVDLPDFSGAISDLKVFVKGNIQPAEREGDTGFGRIIVKVYGSTVTLINQETGATGTTSGSSDIDSSGTDYQVANYNSVLDNQDAPPSKFSVGTKVTAGEYNATLTNAYITASAGVSTDEPDSAGRERKNLKYVYCGNDGLTASWDGDAITHGHDAHRDLLIRFAGHDSTEPENWSALNTDRAIDNWKVRYWQNEPSSLKKTLEKLQYEFGFISKYTPNGKLKYIHIKQNSELSADHTLTKHDIKNLEIANSNIYDVITEMEIFNELHPGESNRYLTSTNSKNVTSRTTFNYSSKENIKEIKLNAHVGTINATPQTDVNADWYSYYNNIVGDVKKIVSCEVVNPAVAYTIETGDIVSFSSISVDPGGGTWANQYFMVVNLNRSIGKVTITAREVT